MRGIAGVLVAGALLVGRVRLRRRQRHPRAASPTPAPRASTTARPSRSGRARPSRSRPTCSSTRTTSATRTRSSSRSCRTTTTSRRSARRPAPTACPTCSPPTSSTCRTGCEQGLFQDITANIDGLDFKDEINEGHLSAGTLDGKEYVLPFVLDLSMLFWNKELFAEAGLDPEVGPGQPRGVRRVGQGHPGAGQARHLRHRHGPELRRMPRLHLVPERVGRRRAGHERRGHRVAARERHRQGDLRHLEGPLGLGRRAPVVAGRGRARPGRRRSPRARSASCSTRRRCSRRLRSTRRRRHPRPRGRRIDLRRR